MTSPPERSTALPAIATGSLIVGVVDITSAFVIWWWRGVPPLQSTDCINRPPIFLAGNGVRKG
jgi:hypothetical protein